MIPPAIGPVVNPPNDETKKNIPVRYPISAGTEIWATRAGPNETYAPEKKPKKTANSMIAVLLVAGIQTASVKIPVI